jgi:di/tricarboxylate transporter
MSEMKTSAVLVKVGCTALALLVGALAVAGVLVATKTLTSAEVNWNLICLIFGGVGTACLVAAPVAAMWEKNEGEPGR